MACSAVHGVAWRGRTFPKLSNPSNTCWFSWVKMVKVDMTASVSSFVLFNYSGKVCSGESDSPASCVHGTRAA